jgi:hypothetical protein
MPSPTKSGNSSHWKYMQYHGRIDDVRAYSRPLTNDEITALYTVVDLHAPVPDNRSMDNSTSTLLRWTTATDDHTAQAALEYKVVYYDGSSALNLIGNAETALRNGTVFGSCDWTAAMLSCTVSETNRHFTVLVRDNAGNTSAYQTIHNP